MRITHPDSLGFLFSRSCEPLTISDLSSEGACELEILVSVGDTEYTFKSTAVGGTLTLRLSDILRHFETPLFSHDIASGFIHVKMPGIGVIAMYTEDEWSSWVGSCIFGGCHRPADEITALASGKYWWTFRPQSALTYKFSKEYLAMARPADGGADVRLDLTLHFATAGKVSAVWYERIAPDATIVGRPSIVVIDCSYMVIRAKADELGYADDTLLAYDIAGTDADNPSTFDMPVGQRFIVARNDSRVRGWMFRNSLGMLDTVYSWGDVTRDVNSEMTTFKTLRTTRELDNFSEEIWSVDTGYVDKKEMLQLWYEFFRSKERYAILSDGTVAEIVVDEIGAEHQVGQTGNLSFKCRLSKETEGYDFTKGVLEDFSDEFT